MPELPEVEVTRRGLLKAVRGQRIAEVKVRRHDLRTPVPKQFASNLKGKKILDVRRRAKYLLIDIEGDDVLLMHLGMSGSMIVVDAASYRKLTHDHILITLGNGKMIVFNDPRRFGLADIITAEEEGTHPLLEHLGPEPLTKAFSPAYLKAQLARRKGPIKPVLMDQKLVVGVGNIYASESLFLCGISPATPAHRVADTQALIEAIRTTLNAAIKSGGSTLRNFVGAENERGYFQHAFQVYDRAGKPCLRCGGIVQTCTHAGRATYWCAQCQQSCGRRQKY